MHWMSHKAYILLYGYALLHVPHQICQFFYKLYRGTEHSGSKIYQIWMMQWYLRDVFCCIYSTKHGQNKCCCFSCPRLWLSYQIFWSKHQTKQSKHLIQTATWYPPRNLPKCCALTWWGGLCALMRQEAISVWTSIPGGFWAGFGWKARRIATPGLQAGGWAMGKCPIPVKNNIIIIY